jgi:hypothetical protein
MRRLAVKLHVKKNGFTFEFNFEPPIKVQITLLRDRGNESIWVLVEPS